METIRKIYKTGTGSSRSHKMVPRKAALLFHLKNAAASKIRVTLYGNLALNETGHDLPKISKETSEGGLAMQIKISAA